MVAVERLDDHGVADPLSRRYRLVHVVDHLLSRHGQTEIGEEAVGEVLVRGDFDGDMRGFDVSAASIRCWYLPWPTWIRLASLSR